MATDADQLIVQELPRAERGAALQHGSWRSRAVLSRGLDAGEHFLGDAGFDRAPWLVVAMGAGIAAWFGFPGPVQWLGWITGALAVAALGMVWPGLGERAPYVRASLIGLGLMAALGCALVWGKSALVGEPGIERPVFAELDARILERAEQPANERVRLVLATRLPGEASARRVRINVPEAMDSERLAPGARIRVDARLMPPAPPMLPGAYNFARRAWFDGLAATGSAVSPPIVLEAGARPDRIAQVQSALSRHVREEVDGSARGIAATLAAGDRGAIREDDAQAMRDAGLAHLLSISGLHVSAVIAAAYLIALKALALWPWLALRVRLPLLAAGIGAGAGIAYTLLTGAQVPTVRACVGALLVLTALALGREALSLRVLAIAAFVVLLLWPESLVGPSFQMSFAAVAAIIALNSAAPVRQFLAPREENWGKRTLRYLALLVLTGFVIEIVLMPIGLHHFHRAGVYGALANVIAIPFTTIVIMPLIAGALLLDLAGLGAPVWWIAEKAIEALIALAHFTASRPGAVTTLPAMGTGAFLLFVIGGLWLALWNRRTRLLGLVPAGLGLVLLVTLRPPDVLISGDGRHVGITGESGTELLVLRDTRSDFVRDNLTELAGMEGDTLALADWNGAQCNPEFCSVRLLRGERKWDLLIARGRERVPERALAASCARADIVIADRWLPRSCQPRWLKADRRLLSKSGGLALDLRTGSYRSVAQEEGAHGWWRSGELDPS